MGRVLGQITTSEKGERMKNNVEKVKMWGARIGEKHINKFNKFVRELGYTKARAVEIMIDHFKKTYKKGNRYGE